MKRLSLATLDELPAPVRRPRFAVSRVAIGIVHLGVGAFHRAHQAVYTDDALEAEPGPWGIAGVSLRSRSSIDALAAQDGLYQVAADGPDGRSVRVIGSLRELWFAPAAREQVLRRLAAPTTRVVTLTITEAGYGADPETRRDLARPAEPVSAIGYLVAALRRRQAAGSGGVALVSCDNLVGNGRVLERAVRAHAAQVAPELLRWIDDHVSFPSTMVDRIVPAVAPERLAELAAGTGMGDAAALFTEPFKQWVIEDRFPAGRPRWEAGGATFVADVAPYEQMKLRLLNASHSAMAYLGGLAGLTYVHECMRAPDLRKLVADMMRDEIAPTLAASPRAVLDAYQEALLARFANPALDHRLAQIARDGSQKIPQRWLGTIRDRLGADQPFPRLAQALAAWMVFLSRAGDLYDPLAAELKALAKPQRQDVRPLEAPLLVDALLGFAPVFGADLSGSAPLRAALVEAVARLQGAAGSVTRQPLTGAGALAASASASLTRG